jgi:hypothetical protein
MKKYFKAFWEAISYQPPGVLTKADEKYLAGSADLVDLEYRMKKIFKY